MTRISRVGIYGGTFNPIHVAHLRAAEEVAEALDLERVVFVPSAQPPHKRASEDDPIAPAEERLAWVRAAVAGNPRFDVDALEVERGGCSFAVETLRVIGRKTAPELPVFIIGQDAFVELGSWREPQRLITLANFAVTTRPPAEKGSLAEWLPSVYEDAVEIAPDGLSGRHRAAGTWIRLVGLSALDISSSDIRARLREGRSVRYLVPDVVIEAMARSGAFAPAGTHGQRR
jgi:nicotinate-nucleotide adenylyltransferase